MDKYGMCVLPALWCGIGSRPDPLLLVSALLRLPVLPSVSGSTLRLTCVYLRLDAICLVVCFNL